jgi:branched-chain amino acid transport system ATP-binding protein
VKENIILSLKNNPGENIFKAILPKFIWNHKEHELEQRAENIIKEIFLNEVKDNLASDISYGQQKILTLGCVIANEPNIMLLDEPVAGVNVSIQEKIIQIIKSIKESGKTILMIEHNSDFINAVSDNILFLDKGKINKYDNYSEFKEKIVLGNSEYF